jgi:protein-L-isoaspartate(D-aspartate) O-methyltransferase
MTDFARLRRRMVDRQIAGRGIRDKLVLDAMASVPREEFVPDDLRARAYEDEPLPIEAGQTISQPYIVALMTAAAEVRPGDRVLEVGAGSGYAAAVLGMIAERTVAIERHARLVELASERMARLGYPNVTIMHGDGTGGCPAEAPFDAILAAASGSHVPEILLDQLAIGGRLVMPVGERRSVQRLVKVTRSGEDAFKEEDLGQVRFVPLIGEHAWRDGQG